jgi:cell division transport system permease protein
MANAPTKLRLTAPHTGIRVWVKRHLQSLLAALGRLSRAPLASAMTVCVIGIALALPGTLNLLLINVAKLGGTVDGSSGLSIFMVDDMTQQRLRKVSTDLQVRPEVAEVRSVSPQAAAAEYLALGGEPLALESLGEHNPFPWVLIVRMDARNAGTDAVARLVDELRSHPAVSNVVYDRVWLERLLAIMALGQRAALVMAVILGIAVVLVVGNTVRLEVQAQREEIGVQQLFGGTDAFIRRPFLWTGVWYGTFGGVVAILTLMLTVEVLHQPAADLAMQYGSHFQLIGLNWLTPVVILAGGVILGLVGAWLAVGRYLAAESVRSSTN